jgi:P27 family predicted phage terminase small subunit
MQAMGRPKKPTKLKELQGTLKPSRQVKNEMTLPLVKEIPEAPIWLSDLGKEEWIKVCSELFNKQMLHQIDLRLVEAYCNAISLHIEMEMMLRKEGRIQIYKNNDGSIKHAQAVPYQKIANDALDRALKIANNFGLTPSARTSINQPVIIQQNKNEYNFFE